MNRRYMISNKAWGSIFFFWLGVKAELGVIIMVEKIGFQFDKEWGVRGMIYNVCFMSVLVSESQYGKLH